ncbi:hypothetical protein BKA69DRAFT_234354 [Paraphysoderma sedebokerense]|nr:hypothetical protein BKA69DRAFT_234354 [Paraphysoderma sedebokerense]
MTLQQQIEKEHPEWIPYKTKAMTEGYKWGLIGLASAVAVTTVAKLPRNQIVLTSLCTLFILFVFLLALNGQMILIGIIHVFSFLIVKVTAAVAGYVTSTREFQSCVQQFEENENQKNDVQRNSQTEFEWDNSSKNSVEKLADYEKLAEKENQRWK